MSKLQPIRATKRVPLTLIVHTSKMPFKDFGEVSVLGEPILTPLYRCSECHKAPDAYYDNLKDTWYIKHGKGESCYIGIQAKSYEELASEWNTERGNTYDRTT